MIENTTSRSAARGHAGATRRVAWPSLAHLWFMAVLTLVTLRVQLTPIMPHDFWWHLATGRQIITTDAIPPIDQFSFTRAGQSFYNQPWLAQIAMFQLYRLGGAELLVLIQVVVVTGSYALLYLLCRRRGVGPQLAAVITTCGAAVGMTNWHIRPQTYALPLFVVTLLILDRWSQKGRGALWALPLVMLAWVNLHGTWILLLGLCGLFLAGAIVERLWERSLARGERWHACGKLLFWSGAAVMMTAVNPRGLAVWQYVIGLLGNQAVSRLVTEWAAPWRVATEPATLLFWGVLAAFLLLVFRRRHALSFTLAGLSVAFTLLALSSVRNILWWGCIALYVAARLLAVSSKPVDRPPGRRIEIVTLNRLLAGFLLLLVVATLPWWKTSLGLSPQLGNLFAPQTPFEAVAALRAEPHRPQRLFHELGFGSYLIWAAPEQRVFIDPRIELYPFEQWRDYIRLGQGHDLDALQARYGFDGWLVDPVKQEPLLKALADHPGWEQVFATSEAVYFAPAP